MSGTQHNEDRTRKMHTITLSDQASDRLDQIAEQLDTTRSGAIEVLVLGHKLRRAART